MNYSEIPYQIPSAGFGQNGKGFFRLTAFGGADDTREAIRRFEEMG